MESISVIEASRIMHKDPQFIRSGLINGILPFGSAVKVTSKRYSYHICPQKFAEYMGIDKNSMEDIMRDFNSKIKTKEIATRRVALRPDDIPVCAVNDIRVILNQMERNKTNTLALLQALNKSVKDAESYRLARNVVEVFHKMGCVSYRLAQHMNEELSVVYNPESRRIPEEGCCDFSSYEGIASYIEGNDNWVMKEIILCEAFALEQSRNLKQQEYVIDAHLSEGNIAENVAVLTKMFYENIYDFKANDFHDFAKDYGF